MATAEDLKTSVESALSVVRLLKEALDDVTEEVEKAEEMLAGLRTRRDTAADHVRTACNEITEEAAKGQNEVAAAAKAVAEAMQAARQGTDSMSTEAESDLVQSHTDTVQLGTEVEAADQEMKERLAHVEETVEALTHTADTLREEIEHEAEAIRQLLGEEAADLQRLGLQITARAEEVRQTLRDDCVLPIAEHDALAETRQEDVSHTVEGAFELAATHAAESVEYSTGVRQQALRDALELIAAAGNDLVTSLDTLRDRAADAQKKAIQAADDMEKAIDKSAESAGSASSHIDTVFDFLAGLGFTL